MSGLNQIKNKNNCLAQAVETIANAVNMRHLQVKAYEWTRTFHHAPGDGEKRVEDVREVSKLWGVTLGHDQAPGWTHRERPADVRTVEPAGASDIDAHDFTVPCDTVSLVVSEEGADEARHVCVGTRHRPWPEGGPLGAGFEARICHRSKILTAGSSTVAANSKRL